MPTVSEQYREINVVAVDKGWTITLRIYESMKVAADPFNWTVKSK